MYSDCMVFASAALSLFTNVNSSYALEEKEPNSHHCCLHFVAFNKAMCFDKRSAAEVDFQKLVLEPGIVRVMHESGVNVAFLELGRDFW